MTIVSSNAKFKVSIDFGKALEDLKKLDASKVAEAGQLEKAQGKEREKAAGAEKERAAGVAAGREAFKFNPLNPLETLISAIGAAPIPGAAHIANGLRVGINTSETAAPFAQGIVKGLADRVANQLPDSMREGFKAGIEKSLTLTGGVSNKIADIKAKNDAIAPTYDRLKEYMRFEMIAGGKVHPQEMANFAASLYKVMWNRMEMQRGVERRANATFGEAAAKGVMDAMTR